MTAARLRVGFIGLGIMGQAMAGNIRKAGFELTVYNRSPQKAEALVAAGAKLAASPAQVAAASEVIVSCVTADKDVRQVLLGEPAESAGMGAADSVLGGVRPGAVVIDCSTVSPETAHRCAEAFAAKGAGFLDAPVSGGDVGAKAGTLSIMVGGEAGHLQTAMPVLNAIGKTITHCGPAGAGYTVKLCNQVLVGLHIIAAAEAIKLASAARIDPNTMLKAISSGAAGSWALSNLAPKIVGGDYRPGFFIEYELKDLRLALDAAHSFGTDLEGTSFAKRIFEHAMSLGLARQGTQAIYEALK